jgi:hypothetical protein
MCLTYTLGRIGSHKYVVLTSDLLAGVTGKISAAELASHVLASFERLRRLRFGAALAMS